jgi:chemotaxis signal transduction protein
MKKPIKVEQLVDQRNALTLYLQALLNEVEEAEDNTVLDSPQIDIESAMPMHEPEPAPVYPAATDLQVQAKAQNQSQTPSEVISSAASIAYIDTPAQDNSESIAASDPDKQHEPPEWAKPRCQVLTFSLGNMQMAAPLDKLNGIIPFPERLTVLPGQAHWFLGLARNRNQNVQVIDLAAVIQPHHRQNTGEENPATGTRYILVIDENRWGILCNSISTVLTLEPRQVQWQRSHHVDFILGTVIDQMQSVLCVDSLIDRLNSGHLV